MSDKTTQTEIKRKPKCFWVERKPNGEKVLCFRIRQHGKMREIKMTMEELIAEFEKA